MNKGKDSKKYGRALLGFFVGEGFLFVCLGLGFFAFLIIQFSKITKIQGREYASLHNC